MSEMFDFEDGNGPVPAHRHDKGGGWVADTAHVNETAYVDQYARVHERAMVGPGAWIYRWSRVYAGVRVYAGSRVNGGVRKSPLVIHGGEYVVTICDTIIQIGCQCGTATQWRDRAEEYGMKPEQAPWLDAILSIAELHQRQTTSGGSDDDE